MFKELYKQLSKFDLILIVTGFFIDTFMKLFNILILMLVLSYKDVINREDAYKYGILCILVYVLLSYLGYIIKNRNILKFSSRRDLYFKTFLNRCMSMPYSFFEDGNIMAKAKEVNSFVASYYTGFEKAYKSLVDMGSNGFFILLVLILSIFVDGTVFISFIFVMIIQVITLFIIDK